MAEAFTRQQRFARRLEAIHAEFATEGGCDFEAFHQSYAGGSTGELTDAAQEIYQAALAEAPTHVPPPRTAFLEQCEIEIYEGLTYVRLDDVMSLLSTYVPEDAPRQAPDHPFITKYVCRGVHKCNEPKDMHLPRGEWRVWLKDADGVETEISPFRVLDVPPIHRVWRRKAGPWLPVNGESKP